MGVSPGELRYETAVMSVMSLFMESLQTWLLEDE
jgi:hypothetical protein